MTPVITNARKWADFVVYAPVGVGHSGNTYFAEWAELLVSWDLFH